MYSQARTMGLKGQQAGWCLSCLSLWAVRFSGTETGRAGDCFTVEEVPAAHSLQVSFPPPLHPFGRRGIISLWGFALSLQILWCPQVGVGFDACPTSMGDMTGIGRKTQTKPASQPAFV